MKKTALIIGSRGMDGSNLSKYLLDLGYNVIGADRRSSSANYWRHEELGIKNKFPIEIIDLTDISSISNIILKYKPDEIYNLGAQSFVSDSFTQPICTFDINAKGHLNLLEAVRKFSPVSKVYFASSSETFGKVQEVPQKETTPFYPRSPYGVSKLSGFWLTKNYRESYGMYCCSGILFNHEGSLRSEEFVTRKITSNIAKWYKGEIDYFELGNLDAQRDWGDSEDYVKGMHLMLQQNIPDDYVLATNETHSIREFIQECFNYLNIRIEFVGKGYDEIVQECVLQELIIKVNKDFYRPCEVDLLIGDYSKAKKELGWEPKIKFKQLVENMLKADLRR